MRKNILLILLSLFILSCKKDNNEVMNVEAKLLVSITNKDGADLLSPKNKDFDISKIKVYYKTLDKGIILVDESNLDYPKGFKIVTPKDNGLGLYCVDLMLNTVCTIKGSVSITILEFDERRYEIKTEFYKSKNSLIADQIFIDDTLRVKSRQSKYVNIVR